MIEKGFIEIILLAVITLIFGTLIWLLVEESKLCSKYSNLTMDKIPAECYSHFKGHDVVPVFIPISTGR